MPPFFVFATPICNSHSRLTLATPLATHIHDSHLRDYTTDEQTVLTPQRHLPSVPTLTLINFFWEPTPWPGLHL